jgi:hypothetical protein
VIERINYILRKHANQGDTKGSATADTYSVREITGNDHLGTGSPGDTSGIQRLECANQIVLWANVGRHPANAIVDCDHGRRGLLAGKIGEHGRNLAGVVGSQPYGDTPVDGRSQYSSTVVIQVIANEFNTPRC